MAVRQMIASMWTKMTQRKHVDMEDTSTRLTRCLTLKRLIFIGVGKTVGVGIYVLIGEATKVAGPSVILAFLLAFLVTLFNGLCFAEYASKNPKTGAQYTYMYETIGEAFAFLVGWTSITGFTAAFSMASRGWSGYVDSLFNHTIQNYTLTHIANWTANGPPFPQYPDLTAIVIILVAMVIVSVGVNFASIVNSVLAAVAASLLIFISVCGFYYANTDNWFKVPGGFLPNGLNGVLKASSSCFYAFQGYEILGYSAEETVNPKKDVPRSIVSVLTIVTILYLCVAMSFTLMAPYTIVDTSAPFPGAFEHNSVKWAKYIVAIGPILALTNLVVMELFSIQRLAFSMSEDGLLFRFLSHVNKYTKVPLGPVLAFGPIGIILVLSIDLSNLIGFMVIYTFVQYSLFAAYLIISRYTPLDIEKKKLDVRVTCTSIANNKIRCSFLSKLATFLTVKKLVIIIYCSLLSLVFLIVEGGTRILQGDTVLILLVSTFTLISTVATVMIWCKEQAGDSRGFLVPLMPWIPVTCMFFNLLMLVSVMDKGSLVATVVMTLTGAVIYLAIVVYDVKVKPKSVTIFEENIKFNESMRLLTEDEEINVETTH